MSDLEMTNFANKAKEFCFQGMKMDVTCIWSLARYLLKKEEVGGFLTAVLENDLAKAVSRADEYNILNIPAYVAFIYNHFPAVAWGSPEKVKNWLNS